MPETKRETSRWGRLLKLRRTFRLLLIVLGATAVSLGVVSYHLNAELGKRFPLVAQGSYLGRVERLPGENPEKRIDIYLEYSHKGALLFVVLEHGYVPHLLASLPLDADGTGEFLPPLTVSGDGVSMTFMGREVELGVLEGTVRESPSGRQRSWRLAQIRSTLDPLVPEVERDVKRWLELRADLAEVEATIVSHEREVASQRAEVERLTGFITQSERLRTRANETFQRTRGELKRAQRELLQLQEEAKKLERSLDLSQRVSGMGKLVALSRESLEREARWVDSMLRAEGESKEDLNAMVARGVKILAIRKEIAREEAAIAALMQPEKKRPARRQP